MANKNSKRRANDLKKARAKQRKLDPKVRFVNPARKAGRRRGVRKTGFRVPEETKLKMGL